MSSSIHPSSSPTFFNTCWWNVKLIKAWAAFCRDPQFRNSSTFEWGQKFRVRSKFHFASTANELIGMNFLFNRATRFRHLWFDKIVKTITNFKSFLILRNLGDEQTDAFKHSSKPNKHDILVTGMHQSQSLRFHTLLEKFLEKLRWAALRVFCSNQNYSTEYNKVNF